MYKPLGLSVGFSHAARGGKLRYCALLALRQEKERDMTQENQERKSVSVLISSTIAFTVCFMVWMVFGVLAPELKEQLQLNETRKFLLASTPVLTGSLVRVPLGIWTDRYGGRIVLFVLMLTTVIPIWLLSYATEFWHFLVLGLFVGLAGGSFSVGTPYVARWFPPRRQGMAMGVFGAGNSGSALNAIIAPWLIGLAGGAAAVGAWKIVPQTYAVVMLITAILFWFFSAHNPAHLVPSNVKLSQQLALLKDPAVLRYCQYYFVVFGGYVGLALYLYNYFKDEYGFAGQIAGILTACFAWPGGVLRALGGWMSDRFGAYKTTWWVFVVCLVTFIILSCPSKGIDIAGVHIPGLNAWVFTAILFCVGIAMAVGKASVFKFISDEFTENIGAVSGIVGLAGGLGGWLLPILFGYLTDLTGLRSSAFMLLFATVVVSMLLMIFCQPRRAAPKSA